MTCEFFFHAVHLGAEMLMISQAELSMEVTVQCTCCSHIVSNFKLLTSQVFFYPFAELKKFLGCQTDDGVSTEYFSFHRNCTETYFMSRIMLCCIYQSIINTFQCVFLVNLPCAPIIKDMFMLHFTGMIWLEQWNSLNGVVRNIEPHHGKMNWHAK